LGDFRVSKTLDASAGLASLADMRLKALLVVVVIPLSSPFHFNQYKWYEICFVALLSPQ
jgi:hypothetical protein